MPASAGAIERIGVPGAPPDSLAFADSLAHQRRFDEAEKLYKSVIEEREKRFGVGHPLVAQALRLYADFLWWKVHEGGADYVSADPFIATGIAAAFGLVSEALIDGSGGDAFVEYLDQHVEALGSTREFRDAEEAAERALRIESASEASTEANLAACHLVLARLARDSGDLQEAIEHLGRARDLRAGVEGDSAEAILSLDLEMAGVLLEQMEFPEAGKRLERLRSTLAGPDAPSSPPLRLGTWLGLLRVYESRSDSLRARAALDSVTSISALLPTSEWRSAVTAISLAGDRRLRAGDLRGAEASFEQALAIAIRGGGKDHPIVADVELDLGRLHQARRDPKRALKHVGRAADIRESAFGALHPLVGDAWLEKANCLEARGDEHEAKDAWDRAVRILQACLGPGHPKTALARQRQARLYATNVTDFLFWKRTSPGFAFEYAVAGHASWRRHVSSTIRYLPETEALAVAARPSLGLDVALGLLGRKALGIRSLGSVSRAWDELIRSRGLVLDEMAARHRRFGEDDDPAIRSWRVLLEERRQRLARLLVSGAGSFSFVRYAERIDAARREVAEAERALYERASEGDAETPAEEVGLAEVLKALPPRSALIAYARYHRFEKKGSEERYLALVAVPGEKPEVVRLERALRIDDAVTRWRDEAGRGALRQDRSPAEAEAAYRKAGEALRALIWDPIEDKFGAPDRIFIVPEATLHLVNWGALPARGDGFLGESGPVLHHLSTERDLLSSSEDRSWGDAPLLIGGPDYDYAATDSPLDSLLAGSLGDAANDSRTSPGSARTAASASGAWRGLRASCNDFDVVRFAPLPGAEREVRAIADRLAAPVAEADSGSNARRRPRTFTGALATETALKAQAGGADLLHVATHGFFLASGCPSATGRARAIGAVEYVDADARPSTPPPTGEHPLRLSGLAFAGANLRRLAPSDADDGVLTSEEIASLDLRSVRWAVLSACDTGVGDVRSGEGVFGLRRAFQTAGARTLVMSLWPVDDQATREWMERLYEARFAKSLGTADAVREANREVLRARRVRGESVHPFYWASFLAVGDWR